MSGADRRLVVWRHGRTAWNAERRFQGQRDVPLDAVGRSQVVAAAEILPKLSPTEIVSSDAVRASVAAEVLGARCGVQPVLHPGLREIRLGGWEGLTRPEVERKFPQEYAAWKAGEDPPRGGAETVLEVSERAVAALAPSLARAEPGDTVVAVTHSGTARAVIGALLGFDPAYWRRLGKLRHARWALLVQSGRGWRLAEHNVPVPAR